MLEVATVVPRVYTIHIYIYNVLFNPRPENEGVIKFLRPRNTRVKHLSSPLKCNVAANRYIYIYHIDKSLPREFFITRRFRTAMT